MTPDATLHPSSTSTATITVLSISPIHSGQLLALADVELVIDGIDLVICGVQVRGTAQHSEIRLPTYRAPDGSWKSAILLRDEIKAAMGAAVEEAALGAGILKRRED